MKWLNIIVDELVQRHPDNEVVVSSGVSPSGTYHLGTLREVLTAEVIMRELKRRGHQARHIHVVDDHDVFRKVPVDVPDSFEKYLGKPLCDIPAPDGSNRSYADYFLADLLEAAKGLHLEMEVVRSNERYAAGEFTEAIELTLSHLDEIRKIMEEVAGRKLDPNWSPIQIVEDGYLKNRRFIRIDETQKTITYEDKNGSEQSVSYASGDVKLNWRVDWPARWWNLGVDAEPFGRDHATKGGSYDTGAEIVKVVFKHEAPVPVPYNFINKTGDTKKMSKSAGDTITAADLLKLLPAEVVWFFILRYAPDKLLFFDTAETLMKLFDEFGELLAKPDKTDEEQQLVDLCLQGVEHPTVSRIPFSHLVASYQASLKNSEKTLEIIQRTEHSENAQQDKEIITRELAFIDHWLEHVAPDDVKFSLTESAKDVALSDAQHAYLELLANKVSNAPTDADGEWFHKAIYECKDAVALQPKELFTTLYQVLIGKNSGPRAGWFLSMLDRDWLVQRLKLEV